MIHVEDIPPVGRKLLSERVNETRHVRTFDRQELVDMMRDVVLNEAGVSTYESKRHSARLDVVFDRLPETVTVKVTVQEQGY